MTQMYGRDYDNFLASFRRFRGLDVKRTFYVDLVGGILGETVWTDTEKVALLRAVHAAYETARKEETE